MKSQKIRPWQFIVISCLSLTVALAVTHISELRQNRDELEEVVRELNGIYEEKVGLATRIKQYNKQIYLLQRYQDALEDLIFRRTHTYLVVNEKLGSGEPVDMLPSRSFREELRQHLNPTTMSVQGFSGLKAADFEYTWHINGADFLKGTGNALIEAEKNYGINALVLAAIIVHESSWGESAIARNKNNLAGLGAFDDSAYSSALVFTTKSDSIDYLARLLSRYYVNPEGKYYRGPHLIGIGQTYASDPYWAVKVAGIMKQIVVAAIHNPDALIAYSTNKELEELNETDIL